MGLNDTPVSDRIQIGFFGCTNAGKSSLINAIAGQEVAIVSEKKGTTTDPVTKTMELGELGPVVLIDTPGLDDDTDIGELRIKRTKDMFDRTDIVVFVIDAVFATAGYTDDDIYAKAEHIKKIKELADLCIEKNKPFIFVVNKIDLAEDTLPENGMWQEYNKFAVLVSAILKTGIKALKDEIIKAGKGLSKKNNRRIVSDIINVGDTVILVIPIDESAPKGRLILPQQQVIRDILDAGANALCIKDNQLEDFFKKNVDRDKRISPSLVITDSKVFSFVSKIVPEDIPLTSFSILMARLKGTLEAQVNAAKVTKSLRNGDYVLISEGCTHHRQCEDIGTVKLPGLLKKYTGKEINIETSSGHGFPDELSKYKLIFHCGGCMLGESEVQARIERASIQGVPVTNYGVAIAYMNGILERAISPFPEIK